ncbi:hypothetical protein RD792_013888 [Penstemon davidsonii]|uniref:PRA1 family protein n=1 Tax=Penstemon davidsonii TaxID=160366 RepID=A0ABR0CQ65_9LAMI|nr:hypothetical protein RD792_013888 [Penstemon davidsonii]
MAAPNSSAPAILPITNPQQPDTQQSSSAVRTFFAGISDTVRSGLAHRRPWPELLDRSALSKPESISEATLRIRKNYNYFRVNYLTVITAVLAISLLTNPFSLILLTALLAAWIFLYLFRQSTEPLTAFGRQFSDRETLLFLIVSTVVVIFLTSVGSVLVSALMVGVAIVCVHGAFRAPEDLFLDEQETQNGVSGFLSFFTGSAQAAATAAVGARV